MRRRCRSCGNPLSSKSAWCPTCGAKAHSAVPGGMLALFIAFVLIILMALALAIWTFGR